MLIAAPAFAADFRLPSHEFSGAMREANWARVLAQRLIKQNLMYQLRLGSTSKQDMLETVAEMDRVIENLEQGRPGRWVPKPPNRKIRDQVGQIDGKWGSLRAAATASPYDYMRRSGLITRKGDPLLVLHFADLAQEVETAAEGLLNLYLEVCLANEHPLCRDQAINGRPQLLSERIVTALAFVHGDIEREANLERLRANRDAYDEMVKRIPQVSIVQEAAEPSRGTPGRVVSGMLDTASGEWVELRARIDRTLEDPTVPVDFDAVLASQERIMNNMIRLNLAMQYFAAAQQGAQQPVSLER